MEVQLHAFLTSILHGGEWSTSHPRESAHSTRPITYHTAGMEAAATITNQTLIPCSSSL